MIDEVLMEAELEMEGALTAFTSDLAAMRTGRASTGLVEKLIVDYYGAPTPLRSIATISVPEAQLISISPFDASSLKDIEKAINQSELGLTPNNDGKIIRLQIPQLTEERRRDLVKAVSKRAEDARVSVRNVRRHRLNDLKKLENEKEITEDDHHQGKDDMQKLTDNFVHKIDEAAKEKEAELMQV